MPGRERELSAGEWAVLGLVAEHDSHGFELARDLAADGQIGRIWSLPRPLVYRAIESLRTRGLVRTRGVVASDRGPARTMLSITTAGRERLNAWLAAPTRHLRDGRPLLLLKIRFLGRAGMDPAPLLAAQRQQLADVRAEIAEELASASGFDRTLASWRDENAAATLRFLDHVEGEHAASSGAWSL